MPDPTLDLLRGRSRPPLHGRRSTLSSSVAGTDCPARKSLVSIPNYTATSTIAASFAGRRSGGESKKGPRISTLAIGVNSTVGLANLRATKGDPNLNGFGLVECIHCWVRVICSGYRLIRGTLSPVGCRRKTPTPSSTQRLDCEIGDC